MKISWLKSKNDRKSFKIQQHIGFDVYEIEDLELTDKKIDELVKSRYNTIVLSNEVAGFSSSIIKKYKNDDSINIIIARNKE